MPIPRAFGHTVVVAGCTAGRGEGNVMKNVLVIDDSVEVLDLICLQLTALGYRARKAADGRQGLRSYQDAPAHVVLLDMFMPLKDGFETLVDLLKHDPHARVIAMTGGGRYRNFNITEPMILLGARKMLYKPLTVDKLQTALEEIMALP